MIVEVPRRLIPTVAAARRTRRHAYARFRPGDAGTGQCRCARRTARARRSCICAQRPHRAGRHYRPWHRHDEREPQAAGIAVLGHRIRSGVLIVDNSSDAERAVQHNPREKTAALHVNTLADSLSQRKGYDRAAAKVPSPCFLPHYLTKRKHPWLEGFMDSVIKVRDKDNAHRPRISGSFLTWRVLERSFRRSCCVDPSVPDVSSTRSYKVDSPLSTFPLCRSSRFRVYFCGNLRCCRAEEVQFCANRPSSTG